MLTSTGAAAVAPDVTAVDDAGSPWVAGEIVRDIARGGLAGLVVGILVVGIGGRLVMRLAAVLVPTSVGSFTENGNRVGDITPAGSVGLIIFAGLAAALFLALVWVVISPWLPGTGIVRGLVAAPIAVAFGAFALVAGDNRDFVVLRHDPAVVATLVALIALIGPAMSLTDAWLERRLPHPASDRSASWFVYLGLAVVGGTLGGMLLLGGFGEVKGLPYTLTTIAVGIVTAAWWRDRMSGRSAPRRPMVFASRGVLVVAAAAGCLLLAPEISGALGLA